VKKTLPLLAFLMLPSQTYADYRDDIAYTQLQAEVGTLVPNASNIRVTQVEAAIGDDEIGYAWMPDVNSLSFSGKNIIDKTGGSNGFSGHSNGVANTFFGNTSSIASGIENIDVYSAEDWLLDGFLKPGQPENPITSSSRVANHSWVGAMTETDGDVFVLKRLDWVVEKNEFIQVTAMNNGSVNKPLLGNAYNSISVGRTDGNHAQGTLTLDTEYNLGRVRPDIVAPASSTSNATPMVSAAVAILLDQANNAAQGATTVIENGDVIYNGERSEVVKAIVMAGADRNTSNTATTAQIVDYREDVLTQTDNGLDSRFGAGQLNVYNNYQIMEAGEQDSQQDGGSVLIDQFGYDYDESFGNDQRVANYQFDSIEAEGLQLTASLVWNINIAADFENNVWADAILYDLNLSLFDVTDGVGNELLVSSSNSSIDNTENLWYFLEQDRDYQIQVTAEGDDFNWDYGLAWRIAPVPVPATIWMFITGLVTLFGLRKKLVL